VCALGIAQKKKRAISDEFSHGYCVFVKCGSGFALLVGMTNGSNAQKEFSAVHATGSGFSPSERPRFYLWLVYFSYLDFISEW